VKEAGAAPAHGCCAPTSPQAQGAVPSPSCGAVGRPVGELTLRALLPPEVAASLLGAERCLCRTTSCDVLYFGADGRTVRKQEAGLRVGLKETEDPIPLCYCFGFTRAQVREEVALTGDTTIPARITQAVKDGACACERTNPSGTCCLGEVVKAVREAKAAGTPVS
jgi:Zinc binding domain